MKKESKKPSKYKVVLNTADREYSHAAATVSEALAGMGPEWNDVKAKGTITISKDGHSYQHLFNNTQLKRMFGSKWTRDMWSQRLEWLFNN